MIRLLGRTGHKVKTHHKWVSSPKVSLPLLKHTVVHTEDWTDCPRLSYTERRVQAAQPTERPRVRPENHHPANTQSVVSHPPLPKGHRLFLSLFGSPPSVSPRQVKPTLPKHFLSLSSLPLIATRQSREASGAD